jgi:hypothetical protein
MKKDFDILRVESRLGDLGRQVAEANAGLDKLYKLLERNSDLTFELIRQFKTHEGGTDAHFKMLDRVVEYAYERIKCLEQNVYPNLLADFKRLYEICGNGPSDDDGNCPPYRGT